MNDNNVRMTYIGRIHELPSEVQETMQWATEATAKNNGTTLTLALNYGSRSEICGCGALVVRRPDRRGAPARLLAGRPAAGGRHRGGGWTSTTSPTRSNTRLMPDPDLVIRTSGEQRISNFLLWQIAYSEIFITDRLWPDFRGIHLLEAILDYQHRERRFGGLGESFTDEDLDTLQPAAEVAEEIATKLTPKQLTPR